MKTGARGKPYTLDARGRFARGGGFGRISLGYNYFGFYSFYAGTYQLKHRRGKSFLSKGKINWGSNPQTVPQQARRSVFADGVTHWQSLTSDQKKVYNDRARDLIMTGFNLHQREYLFDN